MAVHSKETADLLNFPLSLGVFRGDSLTSDSSETGDVGHGTPVRHHILDTKISKDRGEQGLSSFSCGWKTFEGNKIAGLGESVKMSKIQVCHWMERAR